MKLIWVLLIGLASLVWAETHEKMQEEEIYQTQDLDLREEEVQLDEEANLLPPSEEQEESQEEASQESSD